MVKLIHITFLLLITSSFSYAQTQKETPSVQSNLELFSRYNPSVYVSSMEGKVSTGAYQAGYSYSFKAYDLLPVKISLVCQNVQLNNTTGFFLPDELTGLSLGLETTTKLFKVKDSFFRIAINPSFYTDNSGFASSSFRIPINAYFIRKYADKWTFLAGAGIYPDFEYPVFPILGFIYSPNPNLSFNIVPKNPNISYQLNSKLELRLLEAGFIQQEFEIDRDNFKNVILRYREARFGSGLTYSINDSFKMAVSAGEVFSRSFKYMNEDFGKIILKNGVYTEFKTEIVL